MQNQNPRDLGLRTGAKFFTRKNFWWWGVFCLMALPLSAYGLGEINPGKSGTANKEPLEISADFAKMDHAKGIGVFRGHVRLDQGKSHLTAKKLTIYTDKKNQLVKAIAKGKLAHFWSKTDPKKPEFHARALSIEYYAKKNIVVLSGKAVARQGPNSFSGPRIVYDRTTQVVTSYQSKSSRTEIVLIPKTLSGLNPPSGKPS